MNPRFYEDSDADLSVLESKTVAIIGFGRQGHAQALNMRDSGVKVIIGCRPGHGSAAAVESDFPTHSISDATKKADVICILLPDEVQGPVYDAEIASELTDGKALIFGSGFAITYKTIEPPSGVDVILVAPKGPGSLVRSEFIAGRGVHNLLGIARDATGKALQIGLAISRAIGGTRAAVIETTFPDEIETDLFGEQAVLCGGAWELAKAGFETLVDAGYPEELAYFECLHELKQCVDLLYKGGVSGMLDSISPTAAYGLVTRGKRIITEDTRARMRNLLKEIRSGDFAREWIAESSTGGRELAKLSETEKSLPIEKIGEKLRGKMLFIKDAANS